MLDLVKTVLLLFLLLPLAITLFSGEMDEVVNGLRAILRHPGVLVTDYFAVGGIRATILNATLVGLVGWFLLLFLAPKIEGSHIASLCTMVGFSLFGKNIVNIFPILLGCFLFSKISRRPFSSVLPASMFATSLAPVVSLFAFGYKVRPELAFGIGIMSGFLTLAVAQHTVRFHLGYNLYNVGFSGGIVGSLLVSLLEGFGWRIEPLLVWTKSTPLSVTLGLVSLLSTLVMLGFLVERQSLARWKAILLSSGKGPSDFLSFSLGGTLLNMGITGFLGLFYLLLVRGTLNGPTLGGILTMVGFAAYGKHFRNIAPMLFGVYLGALLAHFEANEPVALLAALFSSALAPLAGELGALAGVLGGFLHLFVVAKIGIVHGGLNLYNNGFAAGFVAIVLASVFPKSALSHSGSALRELTE